MKPYRPANRIPAFAMLAMSGISTFPLAAVAADDDLARREIEARQAMQLQAMRDQEEAIRRMEDAQARIQEGQVRREIEARERMQAQALREQEDSIRRLEATQARINASTQQLAQQSADQALRYSYPYVPYVVPLPPGPTVAPAAPVSVDRPRRDDAVGAMSFAPLSDRLKTYFGTQSGVLVVSAGTAAPFGLLDGDVIISIDGRVPADDQHVAAILRSYQPGERVSLRVQRDRKVINLTVTAPGQRAN